MIVQSADFCSQSQRPLCGRVAGTTPPNQLPRVPEGNGCYRNQRVKARLYPEEKKLSLGGVWLRLACLSKWQQVHGFDENHFAVAFGHGLAKEETAEGTYQNQFPNIVRGKLGEAMLYSVN